MSTRSNARKELEAAFADKQWHDFKLLYLRVKPLIDPRIAMRCSASQHRRYGKDKSKIRTSNEIWNILETDHDRYMENGRRQRFLTLLRDMHLEWRMHTPKGRDGQLRLCQCGDSQHRHPHPRHVD